FKNWALWTTTSWTWRLVRRHDYDTRNHGLVLLQPLKGKKNEDRNFGRSAVTRTSLPGVWAERISQLPQHGSHAYRPGRTVCRRPGVLSLHLGGRGATNSRRCAATGESLRSPQPDAAGAHYC